MAAPERSRRPTAEADTTAETSAEADTAAEVETSAGAESAHSGAAAGPTDALSYEQARDELGELVRQLESGGTGLEESLRLWERGEYLVGVCQQWLDGARVRLEEAGTDRP